MTIAPEFAQGILNGVTTYGPEFVISTVFGNDSSDMALTFDVAEEVTVSGETIG